VLYYISTHSLGVDESGSGLASNNSIEEVSEMLFMNICTWDPQDQKEIEKRTASWKWPKGVKVIFEFADLQGGRYVNVLDTDAKGLIASRASWIDILVFETFPVYPLGQSKAFIKKT
jgi:hypothetical protein